MSTLLVVPLSSNHQSTGPPEPSRLAPATGAPGRALPRPYLLGSVRVPPPRPPPPWQSIRQDSDGAAGNRLWASSAHAESFPDRMISAPVPSSAPEPPVPRPIPAPSAPHAATYRASSSASALPTTAVRPPQPARSTARSVSQSQIP